MKTLILNGSPRQDGDTAALICELISHRTESARYSIAITAA